MEFKVTVNGNALSAKADEKLSDVLSRNGIFQAHPCGGRGVCGRCEVKVNGKIELACKYPIKSDIELELTHDENIYSENISCTKADGNGTDIVLDLGTTTLAMAFIDRNAEKVIRVVTSNNPQRQFGADVISRIDYCRKNGVGALTGLIRSKITEMISELKANTFDTLHVAGNTAMLHILAGADPTSLGFAPYVPKFLGEITASAENFCINGVKNVHLLPLISAFVGADIVAGINYAGFPTENYRLLIDLGTNAEIVLFSKDRVISTSASAGPCFEGVSISCGMSATRGAICSYDGERVQTIENSPACGICGTGLVDIIAALVKKGVIDESGYMESGSYEISEGIVLTQGDVRQYQLAKSAIISALLTLMRQNGVDFEDIEQTYISGGFSSRLNIDSAVFTGLIPRELKEKCVSLGNTSLLGAVKSVFEETSLSFITDRSSYTDLSSDSLFSELFIENMGLIG